MWLLLGFGAFSVFYFCRPQLRALGSSLHSFADEYNSVYKEVDEESKDR
jgi:hypothetical protein